MDARHVDLIRRTGPLHDVGKIGIQDSILRKPGRLTDEEFTLIQAHTLIGEQILGSSRHEVLKVAAKIARAHHEKWDGSGYPDALSGDRIPIEARIVAVADVFDVITHARPYKGAMPPNEAMAELNRCSGSHFDPTVVRAFEAMYAREGIDGIHAMADPIHPLADLN